MLCRECPLKLDVVKRWFVATFGNNGHLKRWPRETVAEFRQKHGYELGKVVSRQTHPGKALLRFPCSTGGAPRTLVGRT